MLKRVLIHSSLLMAFTMLFLFGQGQNFIGLHKDEIKTRVEHELSGFVFAKEIFNYDRSFIKFENTFEEQTLLFMLNAEGYCTSISRMYNTWMFNKLKQELIEKYGKDKDQKWAYKKDGKKYEIELVKGEWFVTVITRNKKD